ncbi:hypothetical protein CH305_00320 [Rhodococcus sp. 15-649-2-2]|uniref:hypothetical protein n=1 Tax=Rhodococcus sp. 15-649-2-2 TaxID=2023140 RepID=UPI000B9C3250|nr:hypothetical protein [Rhodococcus sp. 15-649-2-2]OZE88322.1 hypothetical protein CH305_00320 [Rhodococcus sp. 15-649-2-2]
MRTDPPLGDPAGGVGGSAYSRQIRDVETGSVHQVVDLSVVGHLFDGIEMVTRGGVVAVDRQNSLAEGERSVEGDPVDSAALACLDTHEQR